MWKSFGSKFHNHKVFAPDLPGFGKEKLISPNWGISNYADWVVKKLKSKNINKFVLIGHSFGGKIATEIALTNPSIISKLILIASPILRRPSISTQIKILTHKFAKRVLLRNALNVFTNEEYREAKRANLSKIFVKSVNYDATDKLSKIKAPTLIIWGEYDRDAPLAIGHEMSRLIANSRLEILKNTGHNIQFENPNILYGLIKNFISQAQ